MAKTVIIGAVAAGMSAATRLRRLDESAQIVVLEAGEHVSFANCGLPYYVGGIIAERDALLLQTPDGLRSRFNLDVRVNSRVTAIDVDGMTVTVATPDGEYLETYDSLLLSPGARPIVPDIPGAERALTLRDIADVDRMADAVAGSASAVVIGAGFVGLEVAENLAHRGLAVTVVELAPQVLGAIDAELAIRIQDSLEANGVRVFTGASVEHIDAAIATVRTSTGEHVDVPAGIVVAAIGVRPDSALARQAGIEVHASGAVVTDDDGRTSAPHVFAAGDVATKRDAIDGTVHPIPLANLANRHGRRVADAIAGLPSKGRPSIGTAIVSVFGVVAASTGRSERVLRREGRELRIIHTHPTNHAGYYPGASQLTLKLVVDAYTDEILGAQAVGLDGVDKRIDVIATAIAGGLRASELADLELAYAPAFGSAKDPVNMLGYVAENGIEGLTPTVQWHEISGSPDAFIVDVRTPAEHARGAVTGAVNIPLDELRSRHGELPAGVPIVVHCQVGQRGHTAARLLRQLGYDASNLDGGWLTWRDGTRTLTPVAAG
jgi:NADPH-dependent 2,4-dienoyl-CoA reductase/sulfur reductase-like enzyme/rhodanese-related sulfurtransferase